MKAFLSILLPIITVIILFIIMSNLKHRSHNE